MSKKLYIINNVTIPISIVAIFLFLILYQHSVLVKEASAQNLPNIQNTQPLSELFQYYKFQSVQLSIGNDKNDYTAGEAVNFGGTISNQNDYPIVDGQVYVRIGMVNKDYIKEGDYISDEFYAVEDISIGANATKDISFTWDNTSTLASGEYVATFFFLVGKAFHVSGLPFTNEVVASKIKFNIVNNSKPNQTIELSRKGTKVNGTIYKQIGNIPEVGKDDTVTISQPITNLSNKSQNISLTYEVYSWAYTTDKDVLSKYESPITIPANTTKTLTYALPPIERSVYYLKITAKAKDGEKSIVNIRVGKDLNEPRITYVGITDFPLKKGEESTIFAYFHTTTGQWATSTVSATVSDTNGNVIGKAEYSGPVNGNVMIVKNKFTPQYDYSSVRLASNFINKDNGLTSSYRQELDCNNVDTEDCAKVREGNSKTQNSNTIIVISVLSLLVIALGIFKFKFKKK